jgi:hypothetical protein
MQRNTNLVSSRTLLAGCALACFALAFALTPSDVRSQRNQRRNAPTFASAPRFPATLRPVAPAGDAFAPRFTVEDDAPAPARPSARLAASLRPLDPGRVTAIATGSRPTAIVEGGSGARAVFVGDPLSGSRVSAIADNAVRLADGRRLTLDPAAVQR